MSFFSNYFFLIIENDCEVDECNFFVCLNKYVLYG